MNRDPFAASRQENKDGESMKTTNDWKTLFGVAALALAAVPFASLRADEDLEKMLMENPASSAVGGAVPSAASNGGRGAAVNPKAPSEASTVSNAVPETTSFDAGSDIVVQNASVVVPKGEGYEALISANGQGLLVELGLCERDADGNLVVDENGETRRLPLTRGLQLKKGDVLGKQKDVVLIQEKIVAEQELLVAQKEASKTLEVEVAEAAARLAQASYKRADSLNKKMPGSITPEEVDEKYYDWVRAVKSIEKAKYDLEVSQEKVKVSQAKVNASDVQIEDRKFVAPIDGFVDDVMKNEGEWLREGDDVLRVIRLDKVQINGNVDAERYAPETIDGKDVTVLVKRPGSEPQKLDGKIVYVRQVVESGRYYFYADVANQKNEAGYWLLNPGALVTVTIHR